LDHSHSSFPFVFAFFSFSVALFYLFSFSFPFLVFFPPPTNAQVPAERKKSPECQPMALMAAKYKKSKLGPRPLREFPGNYNRKYQCQFFLLKRVVQIYSLSPGYD
jgi:hypothetical protein